MKQCKSTIIPLSKYKKQQLLSRIRYGALRLVSVEQGYDPRDFSLVAFGGAGPLHANSLGRLLGSYPVIIPPSPGVLCALGDATTLLRHEVAKAFMRPLRQTESSEVTREFEHLLAQVEKTMREDQGVGEENQVCINNRHFIVFT